MGSILRRIAQLGALGTLWLVTACGSDSGSNSGNSGGNAGSVGTSGGGGQPSQVEIISWWTAPGEAEALQAVVDVFKTDYPGSRVFNVPTLGGADALDVLDQRITDGNPPDISQYNGNNVATLLTEHPDSLVSLDTLIDDLAIRDKIVPEVLANVTIDGQIMAMPVNVHRENSLFYNKQIFADNNLTPPTTIAELFTVCEALKAAGITPIATSYQGWIQRIMVNTILMGKLGTPKFLELIEGTLPFDDPTVTAAIDDYTTILDNYINADAGSPGFGWTQAADAVLNGEAAMFIHGDWAKGYFDQAGWTPGTDFGVVGAPGATDMFWYGVDVFVLLNGAPNKQGALDFLTSVASIDGQIAFNSVKGSSPMRLDVPMAELDEVAADTLNDLKNAEVRMLVKGGEAWDTELQAYPIDRNRAALAAAFAATFPLP
jgi:glucose/mannose transport system substrate-binding protein